MDVSPRYLHQYMRLPKDDHVDANLRDVEIDAAETLSRRSVERVYFSHEPQYTRYFVKKYQRQSALINRTTYLRVWLVDEVVRRFLHRPSSNSKVIVHLGCGR